MKKDMSADPERRRAALRDAADDADMLFLDGFDEALIGYVERDGMALAAYSAVKIAQILARQGWSKADAWEHLGNNVLAAWVGERTPVIVQAAS